MPRTATWVLVVCAAVWAACSETGSDSPADGGAAVDAGPATADAGGADAGADGADGAPFALGAIGEYPPMFVDHPEAGEGHGFVGAVILFDPSTFQPMPADDASLHVNGLAVPVRYSFFDLSGVEPSADMGPGATLHFEAERQGRRATLDVPCPARLGIEAPVEGQEATPGSQVAFTWSGASNGTFGLPGVGLVGYTAADGATPARRDPEGAYAELSTPAGTLQLVAPQTLRSGYLLETLRAGDLVGGADGSMGICMVAQRIHLRRP